MSDMRSSTPAAPLGILVNALLPAIFWSAWRNGQ